MVQIPSPQSKISLGFTSEGIFLSRQRVPICCPSVVLPQSYPNCGAEILNFPKQLANRSKKSARIV